MLTFKQYVYYISQKSERMFSSCLALPPVQLHVNSRIHTKICVILVLFLTLLAHTNIHFVIYDSYILNYLINLIKVRFNFVKHSIKAALFVCATSHMAIPSHFPPPSLTFPHSAQQALETGSGSTQQSNCTPLVTQFLICKTGKSTSSECIRSTCMAPARPLRPLSPSKRLMKMVRARISADLKTRDYISSKAQCTQKPVKKC